MTPYDEIDAWVDAHFDEEVAFLQALVQVPTDTPPGDNAPHAERTAELLAGFGYLAERHIVPTSTYDRAIELLGQEGVGELVFLIGSYCFLAMVLNAFDVPVPRHDR